MSNLKVHISHQLGAFKLCVDHQFCPGITAIIGPSGAGKTSLLRCVAGFERAPKGHIRLGDEVWLDKGIFIPAAKRGIAMVFQTPKLLPHMNVKKNILLGAVARRTTSAQHLDQLLANLDLIHVAKRKPAHLSGGEKQRVMLARALLANPKILLFDEPLCALASDQRRVLGQLIKHNCVGLNIPVLFVTHSFSEAARLAEQFVYLSEGEILAQGTMQEIFTQLSAQHQTPQELIEYGLGATLEGDIDVPVDYDGLVVFKIEDQTLKLAANVTCAGSKAEVYIWARDVILSLKAQSGLSTRNCLKVIIRQIVTGGHGSPQTRPVLVRLELGRQHFFATITHQALDELDLEIGQTVYALIKSVALQPQKPIKALMHKGQNHASL